MEHTNEAIWAGDPAVLDALRASGWFEGRRFDISSWIESLEAAGFELNELARRVWSEFGGLTIVSSATRDPSSSLHVDPEDACIDTVDEAATLGQRFGENYSPLGMWSTQFRSYIGASGRVIAVGPRVIWELGLSFAEALADIVSGDNGGDHAEDVDWLPYYRSR